MLMLSALHVAAAASAAVLPISTHFNGDMVGAPPRIDQPGQPDSVSLSNGSLIYVTGEMWRLRDKPVRVSDDSGDAAYLTWDFQPVGTRLRVEASLAVGAYLTSPVLTLTGNGMPAAELSLAASGWLMAGGVPIAQYHPEEPLRVRLELDPDLGTFSVAVDHEFNGFAEDLPVYGLSFTTFGLGSIDRLDAGLDALGNAPAVIAFDDIRLTIDSSLGTLFCNSLPNSTGNTARLHAEGSASVALNDLELHAEFVPAGEPGLFFYGPAEVAIPFGDGTRCVSGPAGTIQRIYPYASAGEDGFLSATVDNTHPVHAPQLAQPGSTWKFQAWFRDSAAGGAGFNLSDGITLTLEP